MKCIPGQGGSEGEMRSVGAYRSCRIGESTATNRQRSAREMRDERNDQQDDERERHSQRHGGGVGREEALGAPGDLNGRESVVGEWMRGVVTRGQDGECNQQQADHADGLVDDVARGGANQQKGNLKEVDSLSRR